MLRSLARWSLNGGDALVVTARCAARLHELRGKLGAVQQLRVTVDAGGCGGFQYRFAVEPSAPKDDDVVFAKDGATVVTDAASLEWLRGAVVDYKVDLMRAGFAVLANPGAESSCGCGVSFSPKT